MEPAATNARTLSHGRDPRVGSNQGGLATRGRFIPSDPKNTDVGWGVIHLYRDGQSTPGLYDDTASSSASDSGTGAGAPDGMLFDEESCTTLCILAVPSYLTPSDLLGWLGEQAREDVNHFRLVRTERENRYMVLLKFREAKRARYWRKQWSGKLFSSMDPENCHVVFVRDIEFQTPDNHDSSCFPDITNDPWNRAIGPKSPPALSAKPSSPVDSTSLATSLTTKPLAPPTPSLIELPTCPVCLERMDETSGLLTILCQHIFHCACLEKWRGSGCPVCRFTHNDLIKGDYGRENECSVCGSTQNLWICLICGNTGCGRYDSAHAFAHYEATSHSFAMDITTQHVWDYVGDGYVHRLIQNKADGRLVELPAAYKTTGNDMTAVTEDTVPREKLDNMGLEYTFLLTSQLESQRKYFEEQVERAVDKAAKKSAVVEEMERQIRELSKRLSDTERKYADAQQTISSLEKDASRSGARAEKSAELARRLVKEVGEERSLKEGLSQKVEYLEVKVRENEDKARRLEDEKQDLEEQNRDLQFFISGQEKLKELEAQGEDVVDGRVELPVAAPTQQGGKRKKGKGRR